MVQKANMPCWYPVTNTKGETRRPHIQCNCGQLMSVGNHHIHMDGRVTASFYHREVPEKGCGWHVHLHLLDYDQGEWLPGRTEQEASKDFD